jgi:protein involved in polysaccharide export with SLBB domain
VRNMKRTVVMIAVICTALLVQAGDSLAQSSENELIDQANQVELEKKESGYGQVMEQQRSNYDIPKLEQAIDPDEYILGPYDRLLVNVIGTESRTFAMVVLPEGDVFVPSVGAIKADGLSLNEFRKRLDEEVNRFFKNVKIFCYLQEPRIFRVFVTGEVETPGAVNVSAVQRVSDAVELAGSIISEGSNRRVMLYRSADTLEVDVLRYVLKGDFSTNPFLSNGDRIHVPVAQRHATIRGAVHKGMNYEVLPDESIGDLIDLAGGFRAEAVRDRVLLTRVHEDGTVNTIPVLADEFDMILNDRDELNIIDGMTGTNRVFVFGATSQEGTYYITEGEGLRSLLGRIAIYNVDADLTAATLERENGELVSVDLKAFVPPSTVEDIPLGDGDILHIPTVDQTVAVGGQVQLPGRMRFVSHWTVAQYVGAAGGPTQEGSIDRVIVISKNGESITTDSHYHPNSGDVIIIKRSKTRIFADIFTGLIGVGTLIISIVALSRS